VRIKAAAIRTEENEVWSVPAPGRHHNVIWLMRDMGISVGRISHSEEGFVTDADEFVSRADALDIARAAGQLVEEHKDLAERLGELYSEFVW
jgi:hypothetical protein